MDVVAWSQHLTAERAADVGVRLVGKDELLADSDVVTIHLVLGDRTRGLIGAAELATMKPSAYLVNTSRGPIVDHDALVAALRDGTIAGAGLDVFDVEPLPVDDPLRALPNTVLTPHTGYVVEQCYDVFYREIVEDIVGLAGRHPHPHPVRPVQPPAAPQTAPSPSVGRLLYQNDTCVVLVRELREKRHTGHAAAESARASRALRTAWTWATQTRRARSSIRSVKWRRSQPMTARPLSRTLSRSTADVVLCHSE